MRLLIAVLALLVWAPTAAAAELTAALDTVTLTAHRDGPFVRRITLDDPAYIPLAVRSTAEPPAPGAPIGVVSHDGHDVVVKVAGTPVPVDGVRMLPVTLQSNGPTGTYAGSADLATGTADPSLVKLSIDAGDGAGWALAAVVLGFLAGIAYTLWTGRWVPRQLLRERARALKPDYEDAKRRFDEAVPETLAYRDYAPDLDAIASYQAGVEAAISTWARHTIVADHDAAEYQAILKLLQTAEDDATVFGEQLAGSLNAVAAASTKITGDQPQLLKLMAGRLEGVPLKVGGATQVATQADAYTAFAPRWIAYATEVKRLDLWCELIAAATPADARALEDAAADVAWARRRLLEAAGAADLTAVEFDQRLATAYDRLTKLGVATGVERPGEDAVAGRSLERQVAFGDLVSIPAALSGVAATVERAGLLASQALIPVIGAIVAIVIGLPTIFSDDTFGSWQNYLAAITLGVGAAVGAKGVLAVAQGLVRRETLS